MCFEVILCGCFILTIATPNLQAHAVGTSNSVFSIVFLVVLYVLQGMSNFGSTCSLCMCALEFPQYGDACTQRAQFNSAMHGQFVCELCVYLSLMLHTHNEDSQISNLYVLYVYAD